MFKAENLPCLSLRNEQLTHQHIIDVFTAHYGNYSTTLQEDLEMKKDETLS
jgi:hypothetical protein